MARPRIHAVNEKFFDVIDTESKAYWLGFLYADGHPARGAIMLGLASADADHVERFKQAIGSSHAIRRTERVTSIGVCSTLLSNKFRAMRAESFIPAKHVNHFVRGVFDGDGCICQSSRGYFSVTIAANKALANKLKALAEANNIRGGYIQKHSKPNTPTYILHFTTIPGVCAFRDWIYRGASILLSRKKIIFDKAAIPLGRACIVCGAIFEPRYSNKGAYCSRKCYMRDYYASNRETKWKHDGVWA